AVDGPKIRRCGLSPKLFRRVSVVVFAHVPRGSGFRRIGPWGSPFLPEQDAVKLDRLYPPGSSTSDELVRYTNPDGSCDPRCCGVCPALPCNRAAAFAPCRIVVGGFAGVGGYARLPGLLDDRAGRNHSTALWGDSKLRCAAQPLIAGNGLRPRLNAIR